VCSAASGKLTRSGAGRSPPDPPRAKLLLRRRRRERDRGARHPADRGGWRSARTACPSRLAGSRAGRSNEAEAFALARCQGGPLSETPNTLFESSVRDLRCVHASSDSVCRVTVSSGRYAPPYGGSGVSILRHGGKVTHGVVDACLVHERPSIRARFSVRIGRGTQSSCGRPSSPGHSSCWRL